MIISKLLDNLDSNQKDGLVFGLVFGLAFGLVVGLAFGLADGLVVGLVFGLVFGLTFGLVVGLADGLVVGLVFGLVFGLAFGLADGLVKIVTLGLLSLPQAIGLALVILVISEVLYFLDKSKPEDKHIMWFTIRHKGEAIFEVLVVVINALNVILNWKAIGSFLEGVSPLIMQAIGYVGIVVVIGLIIYGYIYVNSLRYRKSKR